MSYMSYLSYCDGAADGGPYSRQRRPPRTDRVWVADASGCYYRARALAGAVIQPQMGGGRLRALNRVWAAEAMGCYDRECV